MGQKREERNVKRKKKRKKGNQIKIKFGQILNVNKFYRIAIAMCFDSIKEILTLSYTCKYCIIKG